MANIEHEFWRGHRKDGFWYGIFYHENKERLAWNWLLIAIILIAGLYIGMWIAGQQPQQLNVPYLTAAQADIVSQENINDLFDKSGVRVIMLVGADKRPNDVGRSDTLILAFLHKDSKTMSLLNIPRDTYVTIANKKQEKTKINHAYAYGGIDLLKATVENFLGVKVNNYVELDFDAFAQMVDALGGIEIDVEKRMYTPEENIDLQPGLQTLNGKDALGYVRFRHDGQGDIGRIERQQKFLTALSHNLLDLGNIWKVPKMINVINENITTDLQTSEILSMAMMYKDSLSGDLETTMLPGVPQYINNISYWIVDQNEISGIIEELSNGVEKAPPAEPTDAPTTDKPAT